jgi:hypothetical protein
MFEHTERLTPQYVDRRLAKAAAASDYDLAALTLNDVLEQYEEEKVTSRPPYSTSNRLEQRRTSAAGLIRSQPIEHLIALDSTGEVQLYLRGEPSRVELPHRKGEVDTAVLERLRNAACVIHNHPIGEQRPIGGTFSATDIALAERFQIGELHVASVEATYSLTPAQGSSWHEGWILPTERAYARMKASLERSMSAAPGTSVQRDVYFFLRTFDFLMLQMTKRLNMRYQRVDQPRGDWEGTIPGARSPQPRPTSIALIEDETHFRWLTRQLRRMALK